MKSALSRVRCPETVRTTSLREWPGDTLQFPGQPGIRSMVQSMPPTQQDSPSLLQCKALANTYSTGSVALLPKWIFLDIGDYNTHYILQTELLQYGQYPTILSTSWRLSVVWQPASENYSWLISERQYNDWQFLF